MDIILPVVWPSVTTKFIREIFVEKKIVNILMSFLNNVHKNILKSIINEPFFFPMIWLFTLTKSESWLTLFSVVWHYTN